MWWCGARDGCGFERVEGMERVGAAIPPVVARIFSGDSTSPLTREARTLCGARDYCLFARVVGMERLVGVKQSLCLDGRKV